MALSVGPRAYGDGQDHHVLGEQGQGGAYARADQDTRADRGHPQGGCREYWCARCRQYCEEHNAIPACLDYEGFPMSVCTSINEVVCHGIPKEEDVLEEGDIINVDFTTILDGYYADASRMFIIGKTTPEKEQLVRVAKECLEIGMEAAKPYGFVGDIGHAIEKHCKKYGYGIVRDLAGHGVGLKFHEEPDVNHYGHRGTGMLLVPGMVFTIEPMINMGTWKVFIDADDPYGWEVITEDELPSAQWEHTLVMTEHGVEILTY